MNTTRAGVNNWGKVVIGKPLWLAKEAGTSYVYEAICFDKALMDSQTTKIYTKLIKYYPALPSDEANILYSMVIIQLQQKIKQKPYCMKDMRISYIPNAIQT